MSVATLKEICSEIQATNKVLVATHIFPDPDAIGSAFATAKALEQLGKSVVVYLPDKLPERYKVFVGNFPIVQEIPNDGFDTLVVLDTASEKRLGESYPFLRKAAKRILNIDHHYSNEMFGHVNYIKPAASSSAEVVFDILQNLPLKVTEDIAQLLFAGLIDDTGCFRFANASRDAFACAAELVKHGASPVKVANILYFSLSENLLRLRSTVMSGLQMLAGGRIAFVVVTRKNLADCGANADDTEGLVDEARSVAGTVCAVLMRELPDGRWKFSLRAKEDKLDVSKIAGQFGGGGHKAAAGCTVSGERDIVANDLLSRLEKEIVSVYGSS